MTSHGSDLEAVDVSKRFGSTEALAGVSLRVEAGSCTALVGESGSGKTTLLRCFNRMVDPDSGTVTKAGKDVQQQDPVALRRSVGYVQQESGLLPHWSVLRNAAMVPWLSGAPAPEQAAREALDLVGLPASEFGARWPRDLSGGQRQRAALARALASRPGVLLLDEPFGALDAITRVDVQEVFDGLRRALGITALLVTHDLREALQLADQIAVMRNGRIEQVATGEALRANPGTPYVAELLRKAGVA